MLDINDEKRLNLRPNTFSVGSHLIIRLTALKRCARRSVTFTQGGTGLFLFAGVCVQLSIQTAVLPPEDFQATPQQHS